MRVLLLTENPVLALVLEAALLKAGHNSLLLSSTLAQLHAQLAAAAEAGTRQTCWYLTTPTSAWRC